ncbi:unnamed protein product [Effrenium voratum]|nr:unnamed protein product [Effrenium voratum]
MWGFGQAGNLPEAEEPAGKRQRLQEPLRRRTVWQLWRRRRLELHGRLRRLWHVGLWWHEPDPSGANADGPDAGHGCLCQSSGDEPPPPENQPEERYYGQIRDYNESQGFGFIECEEAKMRYGMDVFIHRRQMFGLSKGNEVSFVIVRNSQGQPQARHVIRKEENRTNIGEEKGKRKAGGC